MAIKIREDNLNSVVLQSGFGIGMASATGVNASAILDIVSSNKGILLPRMTSAQRTSIATPATGLGVYDTDLNKNYFYNGTAWVSELTNTGLQTIIGTNTTISINDTSVAIVVSGSNTIGGAGYLDFLKVTNTSAGATNPNKTFRINNTGGLEIINSTYVTNIFSLTDAGVLNTPGGGTSDRRLKNNIEYLSINASLIIEKLKPVKFEFNQYEGIKRHGFIAQDILEIEPELVLGDGQKENGIFGLDYDGILALTVKSLQEALVRINDLEKKIKEVKYKLNNPSL